VLFFAFVALLNALKQGLGGVQLITLLLQLVRVGGDGVAGGNRGFDISMDFGLAFFKLLKLRLRGKPAPLVAAAIALGEYCADLLLQLLEYLRGVGFVIAASHGLLEHVFQLGTGLELCQILLAQEGGCGIDIFRA